jgi:hypothetical protein
MMDFASSLLRQFGLEELEPILERWIREGRTFEEFELGFYDRSTEQGKVVDRLYPELRLRQEAGRAPISITQIRDWRDQARSLMRQYGLPEGFYDEPEDFQQMIVGDVSLSELNQRVQDGYVAVASAPQDVRDNLREMFGVDEGGMAAYFLDPTRATPILERQVAAATLGAVAGRTGFSLNRTQAEELAAFGVTGAQAQQGFGELAASQELFNPLPGENADSISKDEQIDAVFGGNAAAQRRIRQRAKRRTAPFEQGGNYATGPEGYTLN